ncbi:hypothetical protein [Amycolatopsis xylanica]|nr:hypothetical protein [Amycolatopsis xylanica]
MGFPPLSRYDYSLRRRGGAVAGKTLTWRGLETWPEDPETLVANRGGV